MPKPMRVRGVAEYHEVLAQVANAREKGRYALANPEIAMRASKAATTRALHRTDGAPVRMGSPKEADALKTGLQSFAESVNMDQDIVDRISRLDPDKLDQLYRENRFVFEVGFNYAGVEKDAGGNYMTAENRQRKRAEFQHVLDEYDRRFNL